MLAVESGYAGPNSPVITGLSSSNGSVSITFTGGTGTAWYLIYYKMAGGNYNRCYGNVSRGTTVMRNLFVHGTSYTFKVNYFNSYDSSEASIVAQ